MTVNTRRGDWIDHRYEVLRVLGEGGFGVVYLVHDHETAADFALKTFRDEYLADVDIRRRFRREAEIWIGLGRHPYLVSASRVEEIHGRLYVAMDYVAPGADGINSFDVLLRRKPPDTAGALVWAIQFCIGMTHAYSKGLRAHRDIKPSNMLLDSTGTLRISDFGIASALHSPGGAPASSGAPAGTAWQSHAGSVIGTPPYMAPEQFINSSSCDERSDIYSFGIVLFQFATRGRLPFIVPTVEAYVDAWRHTHTAAPVPHVDSPFLAIFGRCLEKDPSRRYPSFEALRADLAALLQRIEGRQVSAPSVAEWDAWEWNNKGSSLVQLGKIDAGLGCFDKALEIAPWFVEVWNNKGVALLQLGRVDEGVQSFRRGVAVDRRFAPGWMNLGNALRKLGRQDEADLAYDEAARLAPDSPLLWANKGNVELEAGRLSEAAECFRRALALDPGEPGTLWRLGLVMHRLGRTDEAIDLYEAAIRRDPLQPMAWISLATCLSLDGRRGEALEKIEHALGIDPDLPMGWFSKAGVLGQLGRLDESLTAYGEFLRRAGPEYSEEIRFAQEMIGVRGRRDARNSERRPLSVEKANQKDDRQSQSLVDRARRSESKEKSTDPMKRVADLVQMSNLSVQKGEWEAAEEKLKEATAVLRRYLETNPSDISALTKLASLLSALGEHSEAIPVLTHVVDAEPENPTAWYNLGAVLGPAGRVTAALRAFREARRLGSTDAAAGIARCESILRTDWLERARDALSKGYALMALRCFRWTAHFGEPGLEGVIAECERNVDRERRSQLRPLYIDVWDVNFDGPRRIAGVLEALLAQGQPARQVHVSTAAVAVDILRRKGATKLPVVMINGCIVWEGEAPPDNVVNLWINWPESFEQAVERVLEEFGPETCANDVVADWQFGSTIRNAFGLWGANRRLIESCGGLSADDISSKILDEVRARLKD